ncbi:hypothetical protein ACFE04_000552 [Oxalis oulophora]
MSSSSEEFRLASSAINHEGRLPRKYTEEGQGAQKNISPPLEWYNVPKGTESLALVVQDIDVPGGSDPLSWTIWVVVNIPPSLKGIPEGFSSMEDQLGNKEYEGVKEGHNDHKVPGYRVPMLPDHGHRFEFKIFALDEVLDLGNKVTKEKLLDAIEGHVLSEAVLMAVF